MLGERVPAGGSDVSLPYGHVFSHWEEKTHSAPPTQESGVRIDRAPAPGLRA